jgi:hypothetical protein
MELGSSVNIVSSYWLGDRAIEIRSPAEVKGYFLYLFCLDRPRRDADHSPPSSSEVENE